jgi:cytochrome bd-type quinol oxidase subunit 2
MTNVICRKLFPPYFCPLRSKTNTMDASLFLAKFWGWYLLIFFLILSYNPKRIQQIFNDQDQKFLILFSFLAIIVGLVSVLFHNVWEPDWRLIITGLGWMSLFLGLFLFVFPKIAVSWLEEIRVKLVQLIYVLLILVGLFLLNTAYDVLPY